MSPGNFKPAGFTRSSLPFNFPRGPQEPITFLPEATRAHLGHLLPPLDIRLLLAYLELILEFFPEA
jgi:hypothetical protein